MNRQHLPLGVYVAGSTPIHRMPAGAKFLALVLFIVASAIWVHSALAALGLIIAVIALYALARIPVAIAWSQIWMTLPVLALLCAFQWWQYGLDRALGITGALLASVMLAALLTLTTTLEAMMDAFERALRPFERWLPVDQIVLAISLTIRLIPLMFGTVFEVLDARKARGVNFSITAIGTPVLIRAIRRARAIADALIARGAAD
ncbi:energy-coupling factor transporter transmembrane component T family protein [Corynebacterium pelargi]|uniref:Energy-coupling factor transporter transmembrane protein BioN n=1 Tax=Corynebacterium pelargi TaxID=1471400 RepID=A0A410W6I1_9CORY|nr:energy-coupling factor transporter transmembrane protein EcfT [Corynebacterium pelargi]QAU51651.1 Energy-coupling factor transporter transmembrane protein BioN [Corynebacterium pelargi]GGG80275.1 ABC transporter permease [Corynebacterium pelargi]